MGTARHNYSSNLDATGNSDGTITDNNTGLMWEKLSQDGSVHDVNNTYLWRAAFTDKIAALNTADGGRGFAGHRDWRLPNVNELMSIVNYGADTPATDGEAFNHGCAARCTVVECSCTSPGPYWTSTTLQPPLQGDKAWLVLFANGALAPDVKAGPAFVRAVRGAP